MLFDAGLPLAALFIAFFGLTNTTVKIIVMAVALLLQFKRTVSSVDSLAILLVFFLIVYGLIGTHYNDYEIVIYQLLTFPVFAYVLGKSFSSAAPSELMVSVGLFSISIAIALLPISVAFDSIAAEGFAEGGRSLYADMFGVDISATVLGGLLTLAISQSAAIVSGGLKSRKTSFAIGLAMAMVLIVVALRLGSRTQVTIFVACLVIGFLLNTTGYLAVWKRIGVAIIAASLLASAGDLVPSFLESDVGAHFRDRVGDARFGVETVGGRTERWAFALTSMVGQPMGWSLTAGGYAHNLWLDAARVSGWIGLFALVVFTAAHLLAVHRILRDVENNQIKTSFVLAFVAANMLFMLEPIMDGFLYVFYAYCAVAGMAIGLRSRLGVNDAVGRRGRL